jgi:hypothetical protein
MFSSSVFIQMGTLNYKNHRQAIEIHRWRDKLSLGHRSGGIDRRVEPMVPGLNRFRLVAGSRCSLSERTAEDVPCQ